MSIGPDHALRVARHGPLVLAHRGDHSVATENTLAAFAAALANEADGVELDVRLSGDGAVVVVHDPHLFRVAGRALTVASSSLPTLRSVDLGGGERVPSLDDALDLMLGANKLLNVEVKGDAPARVALARAVARALARRDERARRLVVVSTFDPVVASVLRALDCVAPIAFLYDAENAGARRGALLASLLGVDGVHPHHELVTTSLMRRADKRRHFVVTWTVDETDEARRLAARGVDAIITNSVPTIRAALGLSS